MSLEWVDIGVNLAHTAFRSDREAVIERARAAGVRQMIVTGASVAGSEAALRLARSHPEVLRSTAGIHPHDAKHFEPVAVRILRELASAQEVVAIGECGLDFNRDFSPRQDQERCYETLLELACEVNMPVFLHERDAHQRFVDILKPYRSRLPNAVVHCFTGTAAELDAYLAMDLHIGITGWICDERRGEHLRSLVRHIPLDRLMLETDAPYLTPRDLRPQPPDRRNEPAFLPHIAATVARCIDLPLEDLATATTATALAFFRLK